MKRFALLLMIVVSMAFAKTASEYYKEASFLYIENRLPSAEILCEEALAKYPQDQKLQMLLDRIREAKEEQKNQNQKNNSENQKDDSEKDKNQDEQNQENQDNQSGNENKENENSSESSSSNGENQGENKNENQNSSSAGMGESSSSESSEGQNNNEPSGLSSSSASGENQEPPEAYPGQMTPEEASQLLKDFDEQKGERKPWRPVRGQAYPEKDW